MEVTKRVFKKSQERRIIGLMDDRIEEALNEGVEGLDNADLQVLVDARNAYAESRKRRKVSINPDTVLLGIFSLVEIFMIIHHEQTGAITSKALGRILRIR